MGAYHLKAALLAVNLTDSRQPNLVPVMTNLALTDT
jgi:hypothetical protein